MSIATEISRLQQAKADLKTAINAKGRAITDETLDAYAAEVDAIETGGGGYEAPHGYSVRFIDYDGTILKEEWVDSGNAATAPTVPEHSGLTFYGWNCDYSNIQFDLEVGAVYNTTDTKTHLFITLPNEKALSVNVKINKSNTDSMTISWGDGSADSTTTTSGSQTITHTYSAPGDYEITLYQASGTGTFALGDNSSSPVISETTILTSAWLGTKITESGLKSAFYNQRFLQTVSLASSNKFLTNTNADCFNGCVSLKHVTIPNNSCTGLYRFTFYASGIKSVSIPMSITLIGAGVFAVCSRLERVTLPSSLTTVGAYSDTSPFIYCSSIKKLRFPSSCPVYTYKTSLFRNCSSLEKIETLFTGGGGISDYELTFSECRALREIIASSPTVYYNALNYSGWGETGQIEYITPFNTNPSSRAFLSNAYKLKSRVNIMDAATNIVSSAFANFYSVREYVIRKTASMITLANTNAFSGISPFTKIYVPDALVDTYKAATNWITYASYIYPLSDIE